ncbi:unnamed protein product [Caenorhabditis angaria]|uniref:Clp1 P-loop domain-containing protein n=1 Tax=Caenorhabditis angaria TaxID=860376 RepID=A0A9P1N1E1_9PELO|nr:unnamed protein product [Caenorhabditis angaria]
MNCPVVKFESSGKEYDIFVISADERLCFYGSCQILCLAGNATLNDFHLPNVSVESSKFLKISAPQKMDIPAILQVFKSTEKDFKLNRLKFRLKEITAQFESIMQLVAEKNCPAVLVVKKSLDIVEEIMASLVPNFHVHSSKQNMNSIPSRYYSSRLDLYIYPEECEKILRFRIDDLLSKRKNGQRVSVLPIGNKGAGKSHFVRNLVNRLLNSAESVYILDVDIGQSEFTPSGCLTLTKVLAPIFGKPFSHQKSAKFENSYFYGDLSPHNIPLFKDIFERLWNHFLEISSPGDICIINSMGWIKDSGRDILVDIMTNTKTDLIIELSRNMGERSFEFPPNLASRPISIVANDIPSEIGQIEKKLTAPMIRDLTTIGYFSKLLVRPIISSIFNIVPLKISFKNVKIALPIDILVEDHYVLAAINNQMMAICQDSADLKFHRICGSEEFPEAAIIDGKSSALKCFGFAIIRAISIEKRELYVVSPVDLENFEEPPIFVRGVRIDLPTHMMMAPKPSPYALDGNNETSRKESSKLVNALFNAPTNSTGFKRSRKK